MLKRFTKAASLFMAAIFIAVTSAVTAAPANAAVQPTVAIAAPAAAKSNVQYLCFSGTQWYNWAGKNPKKCKNYAIMKDGKKVLHIKASSDKSKVWAALGKGYRAANDWCNHNTLTCSILTGIGVTLLSPLLQISS